MSGHIQKQLTRSLERILEEAHHSGELKLSGRKLKDFPKVGKALGSIKYNLKDTVLADLSKNRFMELPEEITEFPFLEKLHLYHNAIKVIPETVTMLQSLSYLDLSRNQMTTLPREICQLPLQTLLVSHNRLVSLPEELGRMSALAELDAGCNEITSLRLRVGDLPRLRCLNLRSNFLVYIPIELTYLKLVKLDISGNRISILPNELRKMKSLVDLQLLDNPLTSPPATLCTRGRTHIFKYLERQAVKHERTRSGRIRRSPFETRGHATLGTRSHRRCNIDSGYNTSDVFDKRWSQEFNNMTHGCEVHGIFQKECLPLSITLSHETEINGPCSGTSTPSTISPGENSSLEDDLGKTIFQDQMGKKKLEQGISEDGSDFEKSLLTIHQISITPISQVETSRLETPEQSTSIKTISQIQRSLPLVNGEKRRTLNHIQTYKEYKEALRQQRVNEGLNVYKSKEQITQYGSRAQSDGTYSSSTIVLSGKQIFNEENANKRPVHKVTPSRINFPNNTNINGNQSENYETLYNKPCAPIKKSSSILFGNVNSDCVPKFVKATVGHVESVNRNYPSSNSCNITWNINSSEKYSFTMKREFERAKEEADLIKQLRNQIETRLKMALPENLAPALADGVVLCHLANHVRPRSVASIHVPSPAVPKLTMARCRRNVDNFLEACRQIGVNGEVLMDADAIMDVGYMEIYGLEALGRIVSALILNTEDNFQELNAGSIRMIEDHTLCIVLFTTFISTLILLYFYPIPD
ncbi:PREDICTED: leucine-rich repeat and calponin homology domain-containing protein 1 [Ceratosolen solmsi marchali]|uniref:Leucine-rich repeat and calponin homology domain-containing protein 1 n=1 Tax=Ceratosolen solmsi marchali TaxID=326594 RepID=A0AAJ7E0X6_9HYME|nr:PREDICTED: leucine-rich repeat and calponin homology domain-containing protein 1 [Ceratosolen solmsi marchali]